MYFVSSYFCFIGFKAYVGYILMEHYHSNPVVHCFARLLLESQNKNCSADLDFTIPSCKLILYEENHIKVMF